MRSVVEPPYSPLGGGGGCPEGTRCQLICCRKGHLNDWALPTTDVDTSAVLPVAQELLPNTSECRPFKRQSIGEHVP